MVERTIAEPRKRQVLRSRPLVALGAVLALLVATVVLLAGGGASDDASDDATPPDESNLPSDTTRPPLTTTVPPVIRAQIGEPGPVLGAATGGLSLYIVSGTNVARVELDTGATTVVRSALPNISSYVATVVVSDDQLVVARETDIYVMPADLSADPHRLEGVQLNNLNSERLLEIEQGSEIGRPIAVREIDTSGAAIRRWQLPTSAIPAGVSGDRLVVTSGGRIFLLATDGGVEPYATGELLAMGGSRIVVRRCTDELGCTATVEDLAAGSSTPASASTASTGSASDVRCPLTVAPP